MDQFYIRLPSNGSMNIYPENRTSSYITKLTSGHGTMGDWTEGNTVHTLVIQHRRVGRNFTIDASNVAYIENDHKVVYGLKLPVGNYSSPTKLAEK